LGGQKKSPPPERTLPDYVIQAGVRYGREKKASQFEMISFLDRTIFLRIGDSTNLFVRTIHRRQMRLRFIRSHRNRWYFS
jgi:hypothetical protein